MAGLGGVARPAHADGVALQVDLARRGVMSAGEQRDRAVEIGRRHEPDAAGQRARVGEILDDHAAVQRPIRTTDVNDALDGGADRLLRRPPGHADTRRARGHLPLGILVVDEPEVVPVAREALAEPVRGARPPVVRDRSRISLVPIVPAATITARAVTER